MDDSAMIIRAKFMAKPGEQFVIRREPFQRVQQEFEAAKCRPTCRPLAPRPSP
jgi:hypothetical protein